MAKKDSTNTLLLAGGIGLLALLFIGTKGKEALQNLLPSGGINFSAPINIPGFSDIFPGWGGKEGEDETESGCGRGRTPARPLPETPTVPEPIIYQPQPDIIYQSPIVGIGDETYVVTPRVPGININPWSFIGRQLLQGFSSPIGQISSIVNMLRYGSPVVDVRLTSEQPGQLEDAPVCEDATCRAPGGMGGGLFFVPSGVGGEESARTEAPTQYAPSAPVITGAGGAPKELYPI